MLAASVKRRGAVPEPASSSPPFQESAASWQDVHELCRRPQQCPPELLQRISHELDGWNRLPTFLTEEYLSACRETSGANALPKGDALYQYNVKWHTTTAKTPKEIHEIGLAEVARIRAEMEKVLAQAGYANRFDDFLKFLR